MYLEGLVLAKERDLGGCDVLGRGRTSGNCRCSVRLKG